MKIGWESLQFHLSIDLLNFYSVLNNFMGLPGWLLLQNTKNMTEFYHSDQPAAGVTVSIRAAIMLRAEVVAAQSLAFQRLKNFFQAAF